MYNSGKLLKRYPCPEPCVMNGELAFRFVDTYGLPLELVIVCAQASGFFIDWQTFLKVAIASGWGTRRIVECRKLANDHYTEKWVERTFGEMEE